MSFLGWSPGKDQETEFFLLGELAHQFDLKSINKSAATFNMTKLKWFNSYYLRNLDVDKLASMSLPVLRKASLLNEDLGEEEFSYVKDVVEALKGNLDCLDDLPKLSEVYFKDELLYADSSVQEILSDRSTKDVLLSFRTHLQNQEDLSDETIKSVLKKVQKDTGSKGKGLYLPIRLALSSHTDGVELYKMIRLLGMERCLDRLNKAILV